MAVHKISGVQHYVGLSTDVKPTPENIGSTFREEDTGNIYEYGGEGWFFAGMPLISTDGEPVSVQNPLPTGDGTVYAYHVNSEVSDNDGFTGTVAGLFNDYQVPNIAKSVAEGGDNPKIIRIVFNRPKESSVIGFGSDDTSLSNGRLVLKGIDGTVLNDLDNRADNTKRGILFFPFEQTTFIEAVLYLYTDDAVRMNGAWVPMSQRVAIAAIDGLIPPAGQSGTLLGLEEEWISGIFDTKNYVWIIISATSDVESSEDGFVVEFSTDKINWYWQSPFTVAAGKAKTFSNQPDAQYLRVRYKNGLTVQGHFALSTQLKPVPSKPSSHRLVDDLDGQDDAELGMSQLLGLSELTGLHENVGTFRRALKVDTALVHRVGVNELFKQFTGVDTTLATASLANDYMIDLVSVVGLTDVAPGSQLEVNGERYHFHVTDITGNIVTLDRRLDNSHAIGADVREIITDMNVDGTLASPEIFIIAPPPDEIWQITRVNTNLTASTAMDDGKFGGRVVLPFGFVLRANRDGQWVTGTIWKSNGDMALDQYDLAYTDKAPAGENGLRGRWTFTKAEFIVELDGATGDYLAAYVQDALSSQSGFNLKAQGRVFGG